VLLAGVSRNVGVTAKREETKERKEELGEVSTETEA